MTNFLNNLKLFLNLSVSNKVIRNAQNQKKFEKPNNLNVYGE